MALVRRAAKYCARTSGFAGAHVVFGAARSEWSIYRVRRNYDRENTYALAMELTHRLR